MIATKLSKLAWSVRMQGPVGAALASGAVLRRKLFPTSGAQRKSWLDEESWFDKRFGVETSGCVDLCDLDIDPASKASSVEYSPTSVIATTAAIDSLPIPAADYRFLDLGCGKGRALVIARELGFVNLTGIELSPMLAAIATENMSKLRPESEAREIRILNENATAVDYPENPVVVFMFNPFGEPIVREVEQQLRLSLQRSPRDCWIVYANAVHREIFDSSPHWQQRSFDGPWWGIYRYAAHPQATG